MGGVYLTDAMSRGQHNSRADQRAGAERLACVAIGEAYDFNQGAFGHQLALHDLDIDKA